MELLYKLYRRLGLTRVSFSRAELSGSVVGNSCPTAYCKIEVPISQAEPRINAGYPLWLEPAMVVGITALERSGLACAT
jgi:hypothetical protein